MTCAPIKNLNSGSWLPKQNLISNSQSSNKQTLGLLIEGCHFCMHLNIKANLFTSEKVHNNSLFNNKRNPQEREDDGSSIYSCSNVR